MSSAQLSVDRVVEIAQCERELAAHILLASRGDVGLAITRIVEGQAGGGAAETRTRQPEGEQDDHGTRAALEFDGLDLDSGAQLSPTLVAQQQAMLVSWPTSRWTVPLGLRCPAF